ncbi:hypothetical protein KKC44_00190, partial [Patescibacteria group bacterium]|nr:hypothetical protein [Patescibacteria group bacterium]
MNQNTLLRTCVLSAAMAVLGLVFIVFIPLNSSTLTAQVECIGLPYGTDGCPLREDTGEEEEEDPVAPPNCGDGIINPDEECDAGRFNGLSRCTRYCTILYCGDGTISPFNGEECEPRTIEVYTIDSITGQLTTEVQFVEETCGEVCEAPVCESEEKCSGGCVWKFLDECEEEDDGNDNLIPPAEESSSDDDDDDDTEDESPPVHAAPPSASSSLECGNGKKETGEECDDGNDNNF